MATPVIAYIDGYNLYHGLKDKKWKWAYWLNLQSLMQKFLKPGQYLRETKYFTSIVTHPPSKNRRQATFLEALGTLPDFSIFYGHFLSDEIVCHDCGRKILTHHEKMTDVNIATQMMVDAYRNRFKVAFLVTADSDLVGTINVLHSLFPDKKIISLFPPDRVSKDLKRVSDGYLYIGADKLSQSLFPDVVFKPDGFELLRPESWK